MNRRFFLRTSFLGGAGFLILNRSRSARGAPANEKLNIGLVGVGGRGNWFVSAIPNIGANLAAFCDVNETKNPSAYERFPKIPRFQDYRRMLDKMDKALDAVVIAAPDHLHAPASIRAMKAGKHVYCEKPLTNTVNESRRMRAVARETGVATQMGNQGTASEAFRRAVELIQAGVLGDVREVHAWTDQGGPGRRPRPAGSQPVPEFLQWDLWLGPRAQRPYHRQWLNWHGWREFGTGNLGNWAPHILNLPFKALRMETLWSDGPPASPQPRIRIKAEVSGIDTDSVPKWEAVRWSFPARGDLPAVVVNWYNGGGAFRPQVEERLGRKLDWGDAGAKRWADWAGVLMVGSKGKLYANAHNTVFTLLPEPQFKDFQGPPRTLPRSPGHEKEWADACKGGPRAMSHFDYSGPLAEMCLLGNVATQFAEELEFDPRACAVLNSKPAHAALDRDHRPGWEI
ncbi:MAG: Gfo/Idh/MocA family oxidoreductase [Verrucomicrobia bacterium]|nr:Gfo/Idh/MocA family oxidoreductase [Verrucomicrobiota bacterium]